MPPRTDETRGSRLLARFERRSEHVAVYDDSGETTYGAIETRARSIAATLLDGRVSLDGERVALLCTPGRDFVTAFFGVLLAGGCVVVLSTLHPAAETEYFCADSEARVALASTSLVDRIPATLRVITVGEVRDADRSTPRVAHDAAALQLYTSGTTGKPKGAVLTHENLAMQQELLNAAWGVTEDDVLLHVLPLHHMHGLAIALLNALGAGAAVRMLPQFDATAIWEAMRDSTIFMAVPTMYAKLFAAFDAADDATRARWTANAKQLRLATSGSAALPVTVGERWRATTGRYPLERYGMTEIGVGSSNPLDGERRPGTVGRPLPTVATRVVDGELWIAGPSVFSGYWKRDKANAESFVVEGGERWFRTGDTIATDADGYVKILGRTSVDILKSGGYKLSALEIEEALREHDAVAEVAVVGLPDETWGDRVIACVVPRAGRDAECAEEPLRAFAKARLAPYKVPKEVVVMRELPRNAVGKVVKPELVKLLASVRAST
jgi:malonyl-CoA/methylmalonyl-CoA synthetase